MANIQTPENFVDALTHRISSIHNPEFESFRTLEGTLDIISRRWRISVTLSEVRVNGAWRSEAYISCSSTSTQKSYALTLLACIEAVEEFNQE